ncbi:MAG: hypothetical protein JRF69_12235 [Deltaproteobacteria bacterium]|nr:hypothetical protein [Deltaproteobacteria bacterium]
MDNIAERKDQIMSDIERALKIIKFYENFYVGLNGNAKKYLKCQSAKYKEALLNIQEVILPSIKETCPTCVEGCCKLYEAKRSIYMAGAVGGFGCVDYLLVRCDTQLPDLCCENAENNLCLFFDSGCTLPADCRSYECIRYFCDQLNNKIDMQLISKYLEEAESILTDFSIRRLVL